MNVGLILTPVSIYQMSRGALVLWVGVLSVIFLRRRLWLYQWTSLIVVTLGVCLVGLSGSLVKTTEIEDGLIEGLVAIAKRSDEDAGKVALGVILILFAQVFTACQYVSITTASNRELICQVVEEKIMSRYKVEPLVSSEAAPEYIADFPRPPLPWKASSGWSPPFSPCPSSTSSSAPAHPTLTSLEDGIRSSPHLPFSGRASRSCSR